MICPHTAGQIGLSITTDIPRYNRIIRTFANYREYGQTRTPLCVLMSYCVHSQDVRYARFAAGQYARIAVVCPTSLCAGMSWFATGHFDTICPYCGRSVRPDTSGLRSVVMSGSPVYAPLRIVRICPTYCDSTIRAYRDTISDATGHSPRVTACRDIPG